MVISMADKADRLRLQKRPGLVRAFFADPHLRYITV